MKNDVTLADGTAIKNFCFFPDSIFKWIKGDEAGLDERVVRVHNGHVEFKSGRKCPLSILNEYMEPFRDGPDPSIKAKEKFNTLTKGLAEEVITDEQRAKINAEESKKKVPVQDPVQDPVKPQESNNTKPQESNNMNPVQLILSKQTSNNPVGLDLMISVNLPNKDLINILKSSFPEEDINLEILKLVEKDLNMDSIKNQLLDKIKDQF